MNLRKNILFDIISKNVIRNVIYERGSDSFMLLGCNYHEETEKLVKEGIIDIDYYKFPSLGFQMDVFDSPNLREFKQLMNRLKKTKPVYLHGLNPSPHNICSKTFIEDLNVEVIHEIIDLCDLKGLSLHLDGPESTITRNELVNRTVKNITYVLETFQDLDFFSLENVDNLKRPFVFETDVITEIIDTSKADFLLDISHAYVTSRRLNMDVRKYIKKLPLDKVYEIHINGWAERDDDIMAHIKIHDFAYELLDGVLQVSNPKLITIEYGRHNDRINCGCPVMKKDVIDERAMSEIVEQVERVRKLIS